MSFDPGCISSGEIIKIELPNPTLRDSHLAGLRWGAKQCFLKAFPVSQRAPVLRAGAAQSTQERRRGGRAARLRWERSLSVRQAPLLRHPYVNFPPVLSRVVCVPRTLQLQVTAAQSSVSHSKPSRIET